MSPTPDALALLLTYYFEQCKHLAYGAFAMSVVIYSLGVVGVLIPALKDRLATAIIALAAAGLVLGMVSGGYRSTAEALKRHQEFVDGLGVHVSVRLLTDASVGIGRASIDSTAGHLLPGTVFASTQPAGPRRLLENIGESAWFSAKISRTCAYWTLSFFVGGLLFAVLWMHGTLIHLTTSVTRAADLRHFSTYGPLTGGFLLFLISTGALQGSLGYFSFAADAEKTEDSCRSLFTSPKIEVIDAVAVVSEYQVSRAKAPFLPTVVYQWKRDDLNELWRLRRAQYEVPKDS